jgi:hypothetical protein
LTNRPVPRAVAMGATTVLGVAFATVLEGTCLLGPEPECHFPAGSSPLFYFRPGAWTMIHVAPFVFLRHFLSAQAQRVHAWFEES